MDPKLTPLDLDVPPVLESALGYMGSQRFVAFYWGVGNEVFYNDGRDSSTDTEWRAYDAFVNHPKVQPHLSGRRLGANGPAQDWLLLDRSARRLYVGSVDDVLDVLRDHNEPLAAAARRARRTTVIAREQMLHELLDHMSQT